MAQKMYQSLSKQIFIAVFFCILTLLSYLYLDKSIAYWSEGMNTRQYKLLIAYTHLCDVIVGLVFFIYPFWLIRFYRQKLYFFDTTLLAFANSVVITIFFKDAFKILFGRSWPATWIHNNPSLLNNSVYTFHWFHGSPIHSSFPSGHVSITCAAMTILWLGFPRLRWLAFLLSLMMVIAQVILYYHFLSDAIAGATLGCLIAYNVWVVTQPATKPHGR